jgi:hypothetical protein
MDDYKRGRLVMKDAWRILTAAEMQREMPMGVRCFDCKSSNGFHNASCKDTSRYEVPEPKAPTGDGKANLDCACGGNVKHFNQHSDESCGAEPKAPDVEQQLHESKEKYLQKHGEYKAPDVIEVEFPLNRASEVLMLRDGFYTFDSVELFREKAQELLKAEIAAKNDYKQVMLTLFKERDAAIADVERLHNHLRDANCGLMELEGERDQLQLEVETLRAAIATPEIYAGVMI